MSKPSIILTTALALAPLMASADRGDTSEVSNPTNHLAHSLGLYLSGHFSDSESVQRELNALHIRLVDQNNKRLSLAEAKQKFAENCDQVKVVTVAPNGTTFTENTFRADDAEGIGNYVSFICANGFLSAGGKLEVVPARASK